jgi:predicted phage terminase large subunit-like protein
MPALPPNPLLEALEWLQEPNAVVALDRLLVERGGFKEFVKLAWHIIEPGVIYADNWHLDAFIQHLERVSRGELKRFAAGIPPRHGKSSILSCLWCAWDWIDNPQRRFIFASYDFSLAVRDSVRTRRVIQSDWYQARWGDRFSIRADENQKGKFENDHTGYRDTMSVGSAKSTGFGADFICFPADEIIRTEHGPRKIGEIVENREAVRVWSYNRATGETELKPVTGWHRNPASPLVRVTLSDGATVRCTPCHEFWTQRGMVKASDLLVTDMLPYPAVPDVVDGPRGNPEIGGETPLAQGRFADKSHGFLGDLRSVVNLAARPVTALARAPGVEPPVTSFAGGQLKNALGDGEHIASAAGILALDAAGLAPNPSETGNGIAGKAGYRSPLLIEPCGHADVTYCVTVADNHTMLAGDTNECGVVVSNCIDDPHSARNVESEMQRASTLQWWNEVMQSRLNDPTKGAFVVVHQRVHSNDVIGDILTRHPGEYEYLCLPARYDPNHPNRWAADPRTEPGEVLWPNHLPEKALATLEASMGAYSFASQFQQLPVPREGGMFKRHWFSIVKPHEVPPDCRYCRGWDLAATKVQLVKADPDYTATVKIGHSRTTKRWYITEVGRWREDPDEVERLIMWHAVEDKRTTPNCMTVLPQDPGQSGKAQSRHLMQLLGGFNAVTELQSGSKEIRAWPLAGQAGVGNIILVEGAWNEMFLAEMCGFPTFAHDDMFDAAATAYGRIASSTSSSIEDFYTDQVNDPLQPQVIAETNKAVSDFYSMNSRDFRSR